MFYIVIIYNENGLKSIQYIHMNMENILKLQPTKINKLFEA